MPTDVGTRISVGVVGPVPTTVYTGNTTITSPSTIEDRVIEGCLRIDSDNVTIRNSIIQCNGLYPVSVLNGRRNFRIEYSQVNCGSESKIFFFGAGAPGARVAHNEATGCQDFFFIQGDLDGLVVLNNYMHTLIGGPTAHADGFQIGEASQATGKVRIRGNYFDPDNASIGKTDLIFGTNFSEVDLLIEDNYIEPWGHYTLRCGGEATRCIIRNNIFSQAFAGVEQRLLLANSSTGLPSEFCCNRYTDREFVEEFFDTSDLVLGADHITANCPDAP